MKKYFVAAVPGSWVVACHHVNLGMCAVSDHLTSISAEREAERRNAQHAADLALAASSIVRHREHAFTPRRAARWFAPDAFA